MRADLPSPTTTPETSHMEALAPAFGTQSAQGNKSASETASRSLAYRPEIDGLRAIAVISVLIYHAFPDWLPGGFIGVDIFFVISGYLITSIILEESRRRSFSWTRFYERRARRLLPPLAPVIIATVAFCFLLLEKSQVPDFAASLKANAAFASNWFFLSKISYFDSPGAYTPLLHTWSLAVEEQFYFVFPIILLLALKISIRFLWRIILGLLVLSFSYATYLIWQNQADMAFYNAAARFWELLAGALLAVWKPGQRSSRKALGMGVAGLVAIGFALFGYDHDTPFPGPSAALPVGGTVLVILAGCSSGIVQRTLSGRPLVGIGLISYALYLWHWPLLVASRFINPNPGLAWILAVLLAAGLLAWASFVLIERPIRTKRMLQSRVSIWTLSVSLLIAMLAAGFLLQIPSVQQRQQAARASIERALYPIQKIKLLKRLQQDKNRYQATLNLNFSGNSGDYSPGTHAGWTCSYDKQNTIERILECLANQASKEGNILVMGDSIGRDTLHALRLAFPSQHFIMLHASSCPPGKPTCFRDFPELMRRLKPLVSIKAIFINFRYRPSDYTKVELSLEPAKGITPNVYLFGVSPVFLLPMPDFVKSLGLREMPPMTIHASDKRMTRWDYGKLLDEGHAIAQRNGVAFVNILPFFCPKRDSCRLWVDDQYGQPLFWDSQHLTPDGIRSFSEFLRQTPELQWLRQDRPLAATSPSTD